MDASVTSGALEELVREHAALRRVATLVAREPSPSDVFAAVTGLVDRVDAVGGRLEVSSVAARHTLPAWPRSRCA